MYSINMIEHWIKINTDIITDISKTTQQRLDSLLRFKLVCTYGFEEGIQRLLVKELQNFKKNASFKKNKDLIQILPYIKNNIEQSLQNKDPLEFLNFAFDTFKNDFEHVTDHDEYLKTYWMLFDYHLRGKINFKATQSEDIAMHLEISEKLIKDSIEFISVKNTSNENFNKRSIKHFQTCFDDLKKLINTAFEEYLEENFKKYKNALDNFYHISDEKYIKDISNFTMIEDIKNISTFLNNTTTQIKNEIIKRTFENLIQIRTCLYGKINISEEIDTQIREQLWCDISNIFELIEKRILQHIENTDEKEKQDIKNEINKYKIKLRKPNLIEKGNIDSLYKNSILVLADIENHIEGYSKEYLILILQRIIETTVPALNSKISNDHTKNGVIIDKIEKLMSIIISVCKKHLPSSNVHYYNIISAMTEYFISLKLAHNKDIKIRNTQEIQNAYQYLLSFYPSMPIIPTVIAAAINDFIFVSKNHAEFLASKKNSCILIEELNNLIQPYETKTSDWFGINFLTQTMSFTETIKQSTPTIALIANYIYLYNQMTCSISNISTKSKVDIARRMAIIATTVDCFDENIEKFTTTQENKNITGAICIYSILIVALTTLTMDFESKIQNALDIFMNKLSQINNNFRITKYKTLNENTPLPLNEICFNKVLTLYNLLKSPDVINVLPYLKSIAAIKKDIEECYPISQMGEYLHSDPQRHIEILNFNLLYLNTLIILKTKVANVDEKDNIEVKSFIKTYHHLLLELAKNRDIIIPNELQAIIKNIEGYNSTAMIEFSQKNNTKLSNDGNINNFISSVKSVFSREQWPSFGIYQITADFNLNDLLDLFKLINSQDKIQEHEIYQTQEELFYYNLKYNICTLYKLPFDITADQVVKSIHENSSNLILTEQNQENIVQLWAKPINEENIHNFIKYFDIFPSLKPLNPVSITALSQVICYFKQLYLKFKINYKNNMEKELVTVYPILSKWAYMNKEHYLHKLPAYCIDIINKAIMNFNNSLTEYKKHSQLDINIIPQIVMSEISITDPVERWVHEFEKTYILYLLSETELEKKANIIEFKLLLSIKKIKEISNNFENQTQLKIEKLVYLAIMNLYNIQEHDSLDDEIRAINKIFSEKYFDQVLLNFADQDLSDKPTNKAQNKKTTHQENRKTKLKSKFENAPSDKAQTHDEESNEKSPVLQMGTEKDDIEFAFMYKKVTGLFPLAQQKILCDKSSALEKTDKHSKKIDTQSNNNKNGVEPANRYISTRGNISTIKEKKSLKSNESSKCNLQSITAQAKNQQIEKEKEAVYEQPKDMTKEFPLISQTEKKLILFNKKSYAEVLKNIQLESSDNSSAEQTGKPDTFAPVDEMLTENVSILTTTQSNQTEVNGNLQEPPLSESQKEYQNKLPNKKIDSALKRIHAWMNDIQYLISNGEYGIAYQKVQSAIYVHQSALHNSYNELFNELLGIKDNIEHSLNQTTVISQSSGYTANEYAKEYLIYASELIFSGYFIAALEKLNMCERHLNEYCSLAVNRGIIVVDDCSMQEFRNNILCQRHVISMHLNIPDYAWGFNEMMLLLNLHNQIRIVNGNYKIQLQPYHAVPRP